jgi:two-component system CheB/CheR fusion protein
LPVGPALVALAKPNVSPIRSRSAVTIRACITVLLDSTKMGTIFLDKKLYIKSFTPEAVKMINLIAADAGRPIGHIVSNLGYDHLVSDAQKVLDTLTAVETEVQTKDSSWYLMRILPYRTVDDIIDGVVLTFSDITELKKTTGELRKSNASLEASKKYAESIVDTVREALLILDADLRVVSANRSFYSLFQVTIKETEGRLIYDIGNRQWDNPELKKLLEEIMPHDTHFDNFRLDFEFPNIGMRKTVLNARRIDLAENKKGILFAIEDVTQAAGAE